MGNLSRKMSIPYLIALATFLLAVVMSETSGAKIPSEDESSAGERSKLYRRQAPIGHGVGSSSITSSGMNIGQMQGNYGFQHNNIIPSYSNDVNAYDRLRSNSLSYNTNSNYNTNYPREKDYYPSSSSYGSGRSSGGIGGIGGANYYDRDNRDYRDRQPYDDYRYNSYQRDALASPNNEFMVRHGQQRHEEYQKRTGQGGPEFYDPFYFIGLRNQQLNGQRPNQPLLSSSLPSSSLSPSVSTAPVLASSSPSSPSSTSSSSSTSPAAPLRNRRNSHQRPNDFYNEINNGKYDIMTAKSAYPAIGPPHHHHSHRLNGGGHHHHHHGGSSNQFLTREQLVRNPDSRVPYNSNQLDYYGSSAAGQPWSVRIGTQLKVNDDGRAPNPHRFYVRDEINPTKSRSRYPLYRR